MKPSSIISSSETPERILIVRLSAIGDLLFASPLIDALAQRWPDAQISWLVQEEYADLLAYHPNLREVIPVPLNRWRRLGRARRFLRLAREVRDFSRQLKARRFDLALDVQGLLKSGLLTRFSGARRRIGLGSREGSQWLMTQTVPRGGNPEGIGSEYRYLAEALGYEGETFSMRVVLDAAARAHAETRIREAGLESGYGVFCPFTTRPQKHWFAERWAAVAESLLEEWGLPVILLGGPGDRSAGDRIQAISPVPILNWAGTTQLLQAAALIQRSRLVLAVDTGLGHMGIAFGRPTLLLFGATCPYRDPGHPAARVLYHPLPCSPCKRRPSCQGAFSCMRALSVPEVVRAVRERLESGP